MIVSTRGEAPRSRRPRPGPARSRSAPRCRSGRPRGRASSRSGCSSRSSHCTCDGGLHLRQHHAVEVGAGALDDGDDVAVGPLGGAVVDPHHPGLAAPSHRRSAPRRCWPGRRPWPAGPPSPRGRGTPGRPAGPAPCPSIFGLDSRHRQAGAARSQRRGSLGWHGRLGHGGQATDGSLGRDRRLARRRPTETTMPSPTSSSTAAGRAASGGVWPSADRGDQRRAGDLEQQHQRDDGRARRAQHQVEHRVPEQLGTERSAPGAAARSGRRSRQRSTPPSRQPRAAARPPRSSSRAWCTSSCSRSGAPRRRPPCRTRRTRRRAARAGRRPAPAGPARSRRRSARRRRPARSPMPSQARRGTSWPVRPRDQRRPRPAGRHTIAVADATEVNRQARHPGREVRGQQHAGRRAPSRHSPAGQRRAAPAAGVRSGDRPDRDQRRARCARTRSRARAPTIAAISGPDVDTARMPTVISSDVGARRPADRRPARARGRLGHGGHSWPASPCRRLVPAGAPVWDARRRDRDRATPQLARALVDEACRKSALVWLAPGGSDHAAGRLARLGRRRGVRRQWRPRAGRCPRWPTAPRSTVTVRSKDTGGRLVTSGRPCRAVSPGDDAWAPRCTELHAKRLNPPDGEQQPARWARESPVVRIEPTGRLVEAPGPPVAPLARSRAAGLAGHDARAPAVRGRPSGPPQAGDR